MQLRWQQFLSIFLRRNEIFCTKTSLISTGLIPHRAAPYEEFFSPGAVATIALWKPALMRRWTEVSRCVSVVCGVVVVLRCTCRPCRRLRSWRTSCVGRSKTPGQSPPNTSLRSYTKHPSNWRRTPPVRPTTLLANCTSSVLSRPRSERWPHHGRTFSIYLCPLSFVWLGSRVVSVLDSGSAWVQIALAWRKVMAAYRRVYDSLHLQADCQEP